MKSPKAPKKKILIIAAICVVCLMILGVGTIIIIIGLRNSQTNSSELSQTADSVDSDEQKMQLPSSMKHLEKDSDSDVQPVSAMDAKLQEIEGFLYSINGYYWYLDGYQYAYLLPHVSGSKDNIHLRWEPGHINVGITRIRAEEDGSAESLTGFSLDSYMTPYNIFSKYHMRLEGDKLYITLDERTYSFTRQTREKEIIPIFSDLPNEVSIKRGDTLPLGLKITPYFAMKLTTSPGIRYEFDGNVECIEFRHNLSHTNGEPYSAYGMSLRAISDPYDRPCSTTLTLTAPLYNWSHTIKINVTPRRNY